MKGCTKPNCNCIEIAEQRNGGPVKSYECLGADKDLQGLNTAHASAILLPALKEDSGEVCLKELPCVANLDSVINSYHQQRNSERTKEIQEAFWNMISDLQNNYTITKK